nr:peptidyl-prolyl cis-trans isomerase [Penaeicola halotolerans]
MERRPHPGELSLSHLILRTVPGDSISNALAQRKIFQLYNELNGENAPTWEKLVATFSEEISTKDNGGKLPGWYGPGTLVAEIEQAAFALTNLGEISAPVKTNFGYHLIRLEGKRPIKSYEEMEESLRGRVMRNTRTEFIEETAYKQLMSVYDYQEQSNTQEILGTLEKTVASGSLEDLSEEMKTRSLFMLQDSSYRVKDFLPFIASNGQPLNLQYKSYVHAMLDSLEERDLLAENKDYRLLLAEFEEGILLFNLMNDLVWNKSLNDTLGLNQYFATYQSKYHWEPRVDALIVEVLSPTYESTVKEIMSEGAGFEEVKEKLEEKILLRQPTAIQLLEGTFEQSKHPILSKITDNVDYHEVNMDGKLYIVNLKNGQAARPQLLEEVRGQVLMDYQNYLDQQLIDTLRSRYSVMINETVWNEIKQSFE